MGGQVRIPRSRPTAIALVASILLVPTAEAARQAPACTATNEGTLGTVTATRRIGTRRPFVVAASVSRDIEAETVVHRLVIRRGRATVLEVEARIPPDAPSEIRAALGRGYKGAREVLVRSDGQQYRAVVDGRESAPFAAGAAPDTLTFPDGTPLPPVRASRLVKRLLRKVERLGPPACLEAGEIPGAATTRTAPARAGVRVPPGAPRAICRTDTLANCESFPGCDACVLGCGAKSYLCSAKALLTGPFFFVAAAGCGDEARVCSQACRAPTQPCCPVGCPFRGTSTYKCFGAGNVCCEWFANGVPQGCAQSECCGPDGRKTCCSLGYACTGPNYLCCPAGEAAAVCPGLDACCPSGLECEPSILGRDTCCAPGLSACGTDDQLNDLCCPDGKCCGADELSRRCCAAEETCVGGTTCCRPENVRGTCCAPDDPCGGDCCPGQYCLNNTTCCLPPRSACGASCCDPLTPCCNGTCCPGPDYTCLGGSCCPNNRACGSTCCPDGYACTDPATGTCQACPGGEAPCAFGSGAPTCCPQGTQCCGNGQCCPALQQCCVFEQGLGCYTSCAN
jgi:hypothetical protein